MRPFEICVPLIAMAFLAGYAAPLPASAAETTAATSNRDCKVVERKSDDSKSPSGSMSSSVTAGGGKVSGHTTGSGQSVTVHSGDGSTSSSVTTGGSSGSSTVVTGSGDGDCVIYVDPGKKEK